MTRINETAYPQLKQHYSDKELNELFTPTVDEIALMKSCTRESLKESQICFMILLKCYQCIGKPVSIRKVSQQIINHIVKALNISLVIDKLSYNKSTRQRHMEVIRSYLQINIDSKKRKTCIKQAAINAAKTKEDLIDIINSMIDHLIKERYEIPRYQNLLRLARASRKLVTQQYFNHILSQLSDDGKTFIDELFNLSCENGSAKNSLWWQIKQEAKNPTTKNIQAYIYRLNWLLELRQKIHVNLDDIPYARLEQFTAEAIALDASDMKYLKPDRRYALAVIFVFIKSTTSIDDLCSVLILWVRKLHTNAKLELDEYRKTHANETDNLIGLLYKLAVHVKGSETNDERLQALDNYITDRPEPIIEQCEKHLVFAGDNYYPFMLKPYKNKRHLLFKIIDYLSIQSASHDTSTECALNFIKQHWKSTKLFVDINYKSEGILKTLDLGWLSEKWFKMVTGKSIGSKITVIHRHYFELAVINEIADALDSGDAYVANGYAFDDPNKQLITWDEFNRDVDDYCNLIKLPSKSGEFVSHLQHMFSETAKCVDERFKENEYLSIENGLPILKKYHKSEPSSEVKRINEKIAERMPQTNIVDVIIDVEKWLNLSAHLKPLSGYETKIKEHSLRFTATTFAYGCNIGPTEAWRCLLKFSRKQIAWLFNHHVTEDKLNNLNKKVINKYNKFDIPKRWGNGESLSVDATYWDMYKKNLLAAHHIRYGDFGGLGYYHIADNYIALHSNFISCGTHESHYLFDGIIENDSDIQPNKVHGDTGAQTEVAFAFGYLLAVLLMPRIRNFKHLYYYKPSTTDHFKNIEEIFCDQSIDWDLIALHYHDMLRAAMSVRVGKLKGSTILRRLCSKSRKNKLYYAFRELGRVIRTKFLLSYIDDPEMRKMIQAGTCKSEEFNQFISWVRFGDGGVVGDNMRFNQQKIIKYGHVVANMVILHVTANMTKVINELRKEGENIPDELLDYYSPYHTDHISRLGMFPLEFDRETIELEYELVKK